MRFIIGLSIILFFAACASPDDVLVSIIGAENSHFQGVSIGDKYSVVGKQTAASTTSKSESSIVSEFEANNASVTVKYEFDENVLYSIQADVFFADTTALDIFEKSLIQRYNNAYGELTEDGGFFVWQENNQVEFTLADESIEFGQPKLSLTIYNFGY